MHGTLLPAAAISPRLRLCPDGGHNVTIVLIELIFLD